LRHYRKLWLVGGALLLLAVFPLVYHLFQLKPASAQGRGLTWNSTVLLIQNHALTGVGTGNFAVNYLRYQADFLDGLNNNEHVYFQLAGDNRYAFNDFLQLTAESGIPGGLIFLLLLFS